MKPMKALLMLVTFLLAVVLTFIGYQPGAALNGNDKPATRRAGADSSSPGPGALPAGSVLLTGRVVDEAGQPVPDALVEIELRTPEMRHGSFAFPVYSAPDGTFELRTDRLQPGAGFWPRTKFPELEGRTEATVIRIMVVGARDRQLFRGVKHDVLPVSTQPPPHVEITVSPDPIQRRFRLVTNVPDAEFRAVSRHYLPVRGADGAVYQKAVVHALPVRTGSDGKADVDLEAAFPGQRVYGGFYVYSPVHVPDRQPYPLEPVEAGVFGVTYHFRSVADLNWAGVAERSRHDGALHAWAAAGAVLESMRPRWLGGYGDLNPVPAFAEAVSRQEFFDLALRVAGWHRRVELTRPMTWVGEDADRAFDHLVGFGLVHAAEVAEIIRGKGSQQVFAASVGIDATAPGVPDMQLSDRLTRAEAAAFLLRLKGIEPAPAGGVSSRRANHPAVTAASRRRFHAVDKKSPPRELSLQRSRAFHQA